MITRLIQDFHRLVFGEPEIIGKNEAVRRLIDLSRKGDLCRPTSTPALPSPSR